MKGVRGLIYAISIIRKSNSNLIIHYNFLIVKFIIYLFTYKCYNSLGDFYEGKLKKQITITSTTSRLLFNEK